ncbi:MAG: HD domain-containing protein, partial [Motiliproteus sp.]|nr:HD domain-containing protein [Motiliproteus sp.]
SELYQQLLDQPGKAEVSRCLYLAHQLQRACQQNPIGLLAALQLNRTAKHQHIKEFFVAILCEMLAKEGGMTPSSRLYLICAALTQDLGMLELQDQALDRQNTPLTTQQLKAVNRHPHTGIGMLKRANVAESLWLNTLEQHHEQPDGKGYPHGLRGKDICQSASILHVADAYVAMVRPRGDRPAVLPKEAIKEIFLKRGSKFDTVAARHLATVLGMYPPGTWVKLYNGEMGVVSGMGSSHPFPDVSVVLSSEGEHLPQAVLRKTNSDQYTVIEMVKAPFHFSLTSVLNPIWPKIKI